MATNKEKLKMVGLYFLKWWAVAFLGLLISNYIFSRIGISNEFLMLLAVTLLLSIVIQIVKSHDDEHSFRFRWFIFYFVVYALIIWFMNENILPIINSPNNIYYFIIVGAIISIAIFLINMIPLRSRAIPWISFILLLLLLVANLDNMQNINLNSFNNFYSNVSGVSESKQMCPTISYKSGTLFLYEENLNAASTVGTILELGINRTVWRIEKSISSCYKGKYQNQNPSWFYCDNMIISRWDLSNAGTINYRWYTAVTAEWSPIEDKYVFNDFSCEGGKKAIIEKGKNEVYVYDSRQGNSINIEVSGDETPVNLQY